MNVKTEVAPFKVSIPSLQMSEEELVKVLSSSLYPGAKLESIKLVIGWCRAQNKDPMKRPVHIVPMSVKKTGTRDEYEWRDVLMPGIGDYRTDAARTGEYAGIGEAKFGLDKTEDLGGITITYPEWCEISVIRLVQGVRCEFSSGKVYWKETYATAKKDTAAPNAMWRKRPRGQIEKCAEAMALRRAFPEVGAQPTADELEGKTIDDATIIDGATGAIQRPQVEGPQSKSKSAAAPEPAAQAHQHTGHDSETRPTGDNEPPSAVEGSQPAAQSVAAAPKKNGEDRPASEGQVRMIRAKLKGIAAMQSKDEKGVTLSLLQALKLETLDSITIAQGNAALVWISKEAAGT